MIDEAKRIISKLDNLQNLDVNQLNNMLAEAESAINKYEEAVEFQQLELENEPKFIEAKQTLDELLAECDNKKCDIENTLKKIDIIELKIQQELIICQESENLQKQIDNEKIYVPAQNDLTIAQIDQEIEAKVMENYNYPLSKFEDLEDINPENLPTLYYVYERVLQEPNNDIVEGKNQE